MNLNELLIKISSLSKTTVFMIAVGVTFFYYSALYDDGSAVQSAIAAAKAELTSEREKEVESEKALREVDVVKSSLEALTQQFNLVSAKLPRELQMAEVIKIVDGIAKTAQLPIRGKEPKQTSKNRGIEVLPIQIVADGKFSQIIKFLHLVTAIERIFRVDSLNLKVDEDIQTGRVGNIKVRADISSYRFLPEESVVKSGVGQ